MKQKIVFIDENSQANYSNNFLDLEANINFIVYKRATLNYFFDQTSFRGKNQALNFNLYIYDSSQVNFSFKISDSCMTSLTINSFLIGQNSTLIIKGNYVLYGLRQVTIITKQTHLGTDTKSEVIIRGALFGDSTANYHGTIYVDPKGLRTWASQENKNILFSNSARATSIPCLEVLTDEVKCSHASAVGYFDKEYLFYMSSRGLDEQKAYELLLKTFLV